MNEKTMTEARAASEQVAIGNPEAEAAEWTIRLGDPNISALERKAFMDWHGQGLRHQEAFRFAQATWDELGTIGTDDAVPGGAVTMPALQAGRKWPRFAAAGAAASALVTVAFFGVVLWSGNPVTAWMSDYVTARSELRRLSLPDGSIVELGPDSALNLAFTGEERRVVLVQGEAYFIAAPKGAEEPRPFAVEAGGLVATALGTQFSVDILAAGVQVVVLEHAVEVQSLSASPGLAAVRVEEGQSVTYTLGAPLTQAAAAETDFATSWRQGRLVFDNRPLGEVVEELNRYRNGRIVIRNAALAERRVSGVFEVSDMSNAVSRIAGELGLGVLSASSLLTILY